ncbi:MAG: adenylosuccinate lyase, partial [SAR324 cluster bacterium]|nr:adenylosuccinate lyase [SAR324 cluster bacterium]
ERITGLHQVLNGYVNMLMGLSGDQWNEGDVACSVVRRVALPGAFWAFDGQLETMLTILQEMGFYEDLICREVDQQLPFLATTTILMAAVRKGGGREQLHYCIKQHALQVAEELRSGIRSENNLLQRLAEDPALPLDLPELQLLLTDSERLVGSAPEQVNTFLKRVARLVFEHPSSRVIKPEPLL